MAGVIQRQEWLALTVGAVVVAGAVVLVVLVGQPPWGLALALAATSVALSGHVWLHAAPEQTTPVGWMALVLATGPLGYALWLAKRPEATAVAHAEPRLGLLEFEERRIPARAAAKRAHTPPLGVEWLGDPGVRYDDVIGMTEAKRHVANNLWLLQNPHAAQRHGVAPVSGILLHGPPGTGKTFFARATAGELGRQFLVLDAAAIDTKWVGEAPKRLRAAFDFARRHTPCVLFIDELDRLAPDRGRLAADEGASQHYVNLVNQLLQELDGIAKHPANQPIVMAATNLLPRIDAAVLRPGRFDVHVHVGLPNATERGLLLERFLHGRTDAAAPPNVAAWVDATTGWSQARLKGWVDATKRAILHEDPSHVRAIRDDDLAAHFPTPSA